MTKKARRPRRRTTGVPGPRRNDLARMERDLEIQFRRIAQIQAELDDGKRVIAKRNVD